MESRDGYKCLADKIQASPEGHRTSNPCDVGLDSIGVIACTSHPKRHARRVCRRAVITRRYPPHWSFLAYFGNTRRTVRLCGVVTESVGTLYHIGEDPHRMQHGGLFSMFSVYAGFLWGNSRFFVSEVTRSGFTAVISKLVRLFSRNSGYCA